MTNSNNTYAYENARLYSDYSEKYTEHHTVIAEEIAKVANIKKNDRILEIGVGTGASTKVFLSYLGKKGVLDGIDISTNMLYFFRKNIKSNKVGKIINGDAKDIEKYFLEYKYDKILCGNSFWCIHDLNRFLLGASKLLKSNGRLIFSIYGTRIISYDIEKIEKLFKRVNIKYIEDESRILFLKRTEEAKMKFNEIFKKKNKERFVILGPLNRMIMKLRNLLWRLKFRRAIAIWGSEEFKNIRRIKESKAHTVPVMIYSAKLL